MDTEKVPGKDKEVVSFIIPIYNGEKYLDCCINSILEQTYTNYEVILVDDGSSDSSMEICQKYADIDARVRTYHKENGGVSSARNFGLEKATGEFISFVDVDDLLDEKYLEVLVNDAKRHKADIVCCDFEEIERSYDGKIVNSFSLIDENIPTIVTDKKEHYYYYYYGFINSSPYYGSTVWAKLIRTEIAKKEKFSSLRFGEDLEYMLKLFSYSPVTYMEKFRGYKYIRWDYSVTKSNEVLDINRLIDYVNLSATCVTLCSQIDDDLTEKSMQMYAASIYTLLSGLVKHGDIDEYKKKNKTVIDMILKFGNQKGIQMKHKIAFGLYQSSSTFYWYMIKLLLEIKKIVAGLCY